MQIHDIFATAIQERIEPVVKVSDRNPAVIYNELANLVVTPQWERYLHTVLDAYTNAADSDTESRIGIWISGFFGSGKSLLMKILGVFRADGSLNEASPLLSALRARLPLAEQDQPPIAAGELRTEYERPPYGWDGNVVKVGLALLLRASACRLIDNGQVIADPADLRVVDLLTREMQFRPLRVQGVRVELTMPELIDCRMAMQQVFGAPLGTTPLVAATLHNVLGEQLQRLAQRTQEVQQWAGAIQCPLPLEVEAGASIVQELLNTTTPNRRLRSFRDLRERFSALVSSLEHVRRFQSEQSNLFNQVRDFFNQMINAGVDLAAVRTFSADFRTVQAERSFTLPARWNELQQSYNAARQAVTDQTATWRTGAAAVLEGLNAKLEAKVVGVGVPAALVRDEAAALSTTYEPVRRLVERSNLTYGEARRLETELLKADTSVAARLEELRVIYRPIPPNTEVHCTWADLGIELPLQIDSVAALEAVFATVRNAVAEKLVDGKTVVIQ